MILLPEEKIGERSETGYDDVSLVRLGVGAGDNEDPSFYKLLRTTESLFVSTILEFPIPPVRRIIRVLSGRNIGYQDRSNEREGESLHRTKPTMGWDPGVGRTGSDVRSWY